MIEPTKRDIQNRIDELEEDAERELTERRLDEVLQLGGDEDTDAGGGA